MLEKVERAIETLPPQCKLIFKSSRDLGMKYQEIADLLKISVKTVETQMGRALKHLRTVLQNDGFLNYLILLMLFGC
ncbi:MAG: sigma-70 family RNA polymerase sigma factor [Bacteroidia bacterium]|nr:sigma-70 family RNA polymerase sigma factor [Bacteroidia bacterium]